MITQEFRPKTWDEVIGQDLNVAILKAIVKSPRTSPRSIILQGEYGSGKTTSSRIFAKAFEL